MPRSALQVLRATIVMSTFSQPEDTSARADFEQINFDFRKKNFIDMTTLNLKMITPHYSTSLLVFICSFSFFFVCAFFF